MREEGGSLENVFHERRLRLLLSATQEDDTTSSTHTGTKVAKARRCCEESLSTVSWGGVSGILTVSPARAKKRSPPKTKTREPQNLRESPPLYLRVRLLLLVNIFPRSRSPRCRGSGNKPTSRMRRRGRTLREGGGGAHGTEPRARKPFRGMLLIALPAGTDAKKNRYAAIQKNYNTAA